MIWILKQKAIEINMLPLNKLCKQETDRLLLRDETSLFYICFIFNFNIKTIQSLL
jgi:hypothetical protein